MVEKKLCRTLWNKACELAKTHIDADTAISKASPLASSLKSLEQQVLSKSLAEENLWGDVADCSDVMALLSSATDLTEDQFNQFSALTDAHKSLVEHGPDITELVPKLGDFLEKQWAYSALSEDDKNKPPQFDLVFADDQTQESLLVLLVDTGNSGWQKGRLLCICLLISVVRGHMSLSHSLSNNY